MRVRPAVFHVAAGFMLVVVVCCASLILPRVNRGKPRARFLGWRDSVGVLPGEFEPQEAILLAWPEEDGRSPPGCMDGVDRVLCEIVQAVRSRVEVVILAEHSRSRDRVAGLLLQEGVPADAVRFVEVPFHSEWIRDYGPLVVRARDGSHAWIDADYVNSSLVSLDPQEDRLPSALGALFEMRTVRAPVAVEHGNLLGNGRGLCIATRRLLNDNANGGYDADDLAQMLRQFYGAEVVVFLERLRGESTGHVDMFATFPSQDTVVVGSYRPETDPTNSAILDRNAERLESLGPPCGPLKVVRIPMPRRTWSRDGVELWPTYTNVVYANDTLLVPVYPTLDPASDERALALYRSLLPDWTIVGIDAFPTVEFGGGLHCATMNLPSIGNSHRNSVEDPGSPLLED